MPIDDQLKPLTDRIKAATSEDELKQSILEALNSLNEMFSKGEIDRREFAYGIVDSCLKFQLHDNAPDDERLDLIVDLASFLEMEGTDKLEPAKNSKYDTLYQMSVAYYESGGAPLEEPYVNPELV